MSDPRPPVAIGHVRHPATDAAASVDYLVKLGMRHIHQTENFAVLELRGGTHVVVAPAEGAVEAGAQARFDLIVDDIEKTREEYAAQGFEPSSLGRGRSVRWVRARPVNPSARMCNGNANGKQLAELNRFHSRGFHDAFRQVGGL